MATEEPRIKRAFDLTLREIANRYPADLVFLALHKQVESIEVLSPDLPASERRMDWLVRVTVEGETFSLQTDFQTEYSEEKVLVWLDYRVRARILHGLPVYSVVIYLTDKGYPGPGRNRFEETILGETQHLFQFKEVRLWELDAKEVLASAATGLIPLLPLMRGPSVESLLRSAVDEVSRVTDNQLRMNLLVATAVFGNLKCPKEVILNLIGRQAMKELPIIEDFFKEGWEEGRKKGWEVGLEVGREEGREEGLEKGLEEGLAKGLLIGRIQAYQKLSRNPVTPEMDLRQETLEDLRRMVETLEREVMDSQAEAQ